MDYQKTCDTASHASVWEAFKAKDVESDRIEMLKNICPKCTKESI